MKLLFSYLVIVLLILSCREKNSSAHNGKYILGKITPAEKKSILHYLDSIHFHSDDVFVFADKSDFRLYLLKDTVILKWYPVVLGFNPVDDKLKQGDGCTPEGVFLVRDKYPHKKWHKFIWLDYPNKESWRKHTEAKENSQIAASAAIGGEVGIHGVPDGMNWVVDVRRNWTLGCISLKNEDVNEVYENVKVGTKIVIRK